MIESPCDIQAVTCGQSGTPPLTHTLSLSGVKYLYILMAMPSTDHDTSSPAPRGTRRTTTSAAGALVLKRLACSEELLPMVPEALQPAETPTAEDHALVCRMLDEVPCCPSTPAWPLQLSSGIEHAVRVGTVLDGDYV